MAPLNKLETVVVAIIVSAFLCFILFIFPFYYYYFSNTKHSGSWTSIPTQPNCYL